MDYKKILVALEYGVESEEVFERAVAIAKSSGASLMLFHCITTDINYLEDSPSVYSESIKDFAAKFKEGRDLVEQQLAEYSQKATDLGINVEWKCEADKPEKAILNLAKSWDADLIVMGRRGLSGLKELLLGSVSNYVVYHAPCSVLIVKLNG